MRWCCWLLPAAPAGSVLACSPTRPAACQTLAHGLVASIAQLGVPKYGGALPSHPETCCGVAAHGSLCRRLASQACWALVTAVPRCPMAVHGSMIKLDAGGRTC